MLLQQASLHTQQGQALPAQGTQATQEADQHRGAHPFLQQQQPPAHRYPTPPRRTRQGQTQMRQAHQTNQPHGFRNEQRRHESPRLQLQVETPLQPVYRPAQPQRQQQQATRPAQPQWQQQPVHHPAQPQQQQQAPRLAYPQQQQQQAPRPAQQTSAQYYR
ncbi:hypothetical protein BJ508DRAFT_322872 [Ascobolus immersus RN42]|uniref:Uncharacterized protein n=1 Tax=Ascobolus immersus RN42 TaxID=1160509 RepID=A0A3N4IHE4_ASCIM|nr:hypothetical protein BJ508DRAFT_322872 [Ascobolus immersus RN42]